MSPTTVSDDLLAALSQLGFTQYEARAYCALLVEAPMNGHEVARASGVPPSKIYETLIRLADKGAVLVQHSDPVTYAPSPQAAVLDAARRKFQRAFDAAESALSRLPGKAGPGEIWSLRDREAVISACIARIDGATQTVFAALWDDELVELREPLERASRRGCEVHVAVYGLASLQGPSSYDLSLCGYSAMERLGGHRLSVLVADKVGTMLAEFRADGSVEAITSDNPVISLAATEYVKADVLGRLLINDMGEDHFASIRGDPGIIDRLLRS